MLHSALLCLSFFVLGRRARATTPGSPDFEVSREITGAAQLNDIDPVGLHGLQRSEFGTRYGIRHMNNHPIGSYEEWVLAFGPDKRVSQFHTYVTHRQYGW